MTYEACVRYQLDPDKAVYYYETVGWFNDREEAQEAADDAVAQWPENVAPKAIVRRESQWAQSNAELWRGARIDL